MNLKSRVKWRIVSPFLEYNSFSWTKWIFVSWELHNILFVVMELRVWTTVFAKELLKYEHLAWGHFLSVDFPGLHIFPFNQTNSFESCNKWQLCCANLFFRDSKATHSFKSLYISSPSTYIFHMGFKSISQLTHALITRAHHFHSPSFDHHETKWTVRYPGNRINIPWPLLETLQLIRERILLHLPTIIRKPEAPPPPVLQ